MGHERLHRVAGALAMVFAGMFFAGLLVVATLFPNPADGPTPSSTRIGYFIVFASFLVGLGLIPVAMWIVERRAGRQPALAWRVVTAVGVVVAMVVVGWGVRTWAYPPHDLHQCFTDYRGNGHSGIWGHVCESGLVNRPFGLRRLNEGFIGAFIVLVVTGVWSARLISKPRAGAQGSDGGLE